MRFGTVFQDPVTYNVYIAEHAYKYNNYTNVFMQTVHVIRLESIMQLPISYAYDHCSSLLCSANEIKLGNMLKIF